MENEASFIPIYVALILIAFVVGYAARYYARGRGKTDTSESFSVSSGRLRLIIICALLLLFFLITRTDDVVEFAKIFFLSND